MHTDIQVAYRTHTHTHTDTHTECPWESTLPSLLSLSLFPHLFLLSPLPLSYITSLPLLFSIFSSFSSLTFPALIYLFFFLNLFLSPMRVFLFSSFSPSFSFFSLIHSLSFSHTGCKRCALWLPGSYHGNILHYWWSALIASQAAPKLSQQSTTSSAAF